MFTFFTYLLVFSGNSFLIPSPLLFTRRSCIFAALMASSVDIMRHWRLRSVSLQPAPVDIKARFEQCYLLVAGFYFIFRWPTSMLFRAGGRTPRTPGRGGGGLAYVRGLVTLRMKFFSSYRAMHFSAFARSWDRMSSVCPSVCLSVTLVICDHTGWKCRKLITRTISPTPSLFVAKRRSTYSQGNMGKFWGD